MTRWVDSGVSLRVTRWDARQGFWRCAEADQSLRGTIDRPQRTTLNSTANSRLELIEVADQEVTCPCPGPLRDSY
jgi:hypothetical protein